MADALQNNVIGRFYRDGVEITATAAQLNNTANIPTAAAQADQETGTSTTTFVSPGRQQYHPSSVKAWCNVAASGSTFTLNASYNITSVTDSGVGDCRMNLTVANSSSTLMAASFTGNTSPSATVTPLYIFDNFSASAWRCLIYNVNNPASPAVVDNFGFFGILTGDQ